MSRFTRPPIFIFRSIAPSFPTAPPHARGRWSQRNTAEHSSATGTAQLESSLDITSRCAPIRPTISETRMTREGGGMNRSQLQEYGGDEPIWGFVAQLGAERFTGQADVGDAPRVHLYAAEGRVYFAERDGDAPVESRLVASGALTDEQLQCGGVASRRLRVPRPSLPSRPVHRPRPRAGHARHAQRRRARVGRQRARRSRWCWSRSVTIPSGVHQWTAELPPPSPARCRSTRPSPRWRPRWALPDACRAPSADEVPSVRARAEIAPDIAPAADRRPSSNEPASRRCPRSVRSARGSHRTPAAHR